MLVVGLRLVHDDPGCWRTPDLSLEASERENRVAVPQDQRRYYGRNIGRTGHELNSHLHVCCVAGIGVNYGPRMTSRHSDQ